MLLLVPNRYEFSFSKSYFLQILKCKINVVQYFDKNFKEFSLMLKWGLGTIHWEFMHWALLNSWKRIGRSLQDAKLSIELQYIFQTFIINII